MKRALIKALVLILIASVIAGVLALTAYAHPGDTDSRGGHYNRTTGVYHYHHGYPAHSHINGVCPYEKTAEKGEEKLEYIHVVLGDDTDDNSEVLEVVKFVVAVLIIVIVPGGLFIYKKRRSARIDADQTVTDGKGNKATVILAVLLSFVFLAMWAAFSYVLGNVFGFLSSLIGKNSVVEWFYSVRLDTYLPISLGALFAFLIMMNIEFTPYQKTESISVIIGSTIVLLYHAFLFIKNTGSPDAHNSYLFVVVTCVTLIFESVRNLRALKVERDADIQD